MKFYSKWERERAREKKQSAIVINASLNIKSFQMDLEEMNGKFESNEQEKKSSSEE